jgi:hypothetical protein
LVLFYFLILWILPLHLTFFFNFFNFKLFFLFILFK